MSHSIFTKLQSYHISINQSNEMELLATTENIIIHKNQKNIYDFLPKTYNFNKLVKVRNKLHDKVLYYMTNYNLNQQQKYLYKFNQIEKIIKRLLSTA